MAQPRVTEFTAFPDLDALSHEAARCIVVGAREAALYTGRCSIALSGGSTPRRLYQLLASDEYRDIVPWEVIEWYWGDERCVPPDHPESNYRMAWELMLSKVPVPGGQVHRMPGEAPDPARAARAYEVLLRDRIPDQALDIVLLGIGDDGHTASLFPGHAALEERERLVAHVRGPAHLAVRDRLTLTLPALDRARTILVLVDGAAKRPIVEAMEADMRAAAERYPIARVRNDGQMTVLTSEK